jgi:hypothetical protein
MCVLKCSTDIVSKSSYLSISAIDCSKALIKKEGPIRFKSECVHWPHPRKRQTRKRAGRTPDSEEQENQGEGETIFESRQPLATCGTGAKEGRKERWEGGRVEKQRGIGHRIFILEGEVRGQPSGRRNSHGRC